MSAAVPQELGAARPTSSLRRDALKRLREHRVALLGAAVLSLLILVGLLAPLIAPHDPNIASSPRPYAGISSAHLLGTDGEARDVLSRVMWGGRPALAAALLPALIAFPPALFFGILAAQARGLVEEVLMRIVDVGLSFPTVLLAIAIAGVAGRGFWTVVIALGVALMPYLTRVTYSITQTLRSTDFIIAAKATGERPWQVLIWELLPNVLPAMVVYVTSLLGGLMVLSAGLSFFGLGVRPPAADWGQMINDGLAALPTSPLVSLAPAIVLVIAAMCFSAIGDGIRDLLDPRS